MLSVQHLSKSFSGAAVLKDVSFEIRKGEILGLIGPNGSGKTTVLETVSGMLHHGTGEVRWNGGSLPPDRRKDVLFYMPDGILTYGNQTVRRVLGLFVRAFQAEAKSLSVVLKELELESVLDKRVDALSKGFRRRLLLGISFLTSQPILFLDEPFDGLDLKQTLSVVRLLRNLPSEGRTLFLSIHQLSDAERICDRFILLSNGQVIGIGTLEELRRRASLPSGRLEEVFLALT